MSKTPSLQVHLQLPDGPDRNALRAGLLALQCIPVNLAAAGAALTQQLQALALNPQAVVFFDVSNALPQISHRFDDCLQAWPQALRGRTVLTRLAAGHVSLADRAWATSLGFADLAASFEDTSPTAALRQALDLVARTVGLPTLANGEIERYRGAAPRSPLPPSARALVRARTGMQAEVLTDWLRDRLDIRDRSYHFKKYPACFLGTEAVRWMGQHFQLDAQAVVEVGQALQTLGLLYHVAHEQAFADATLFFRLRAPGELPQIDLGLAWQALRDRLAVGTRSHLGQAYPSCWVGQDAVDLLCAQHALARHEGQLVLHRLMQFGVFEHVVAAHGFIDGHFFYRFNARRD